MSALSQRLQDFAILPEVEVIARHLCWEDGRLADMIVDNEPLWHVYIERAEGIVVALCEAGLRIIKQ